MSETKKQLSTFEWRQFRNVIILWFIAKAKIKPYQLVRLYYSDLYTIHGEPRSVFVMPKRIDKNGLQAPKFVPTPMRTVLRILYPQRPLFATCQPLISSKPDQRPLTAAYVRQIVRRASDEYYYAENVLLKYLGVNSVLFGEQT